MSGYFEFLDIQYKLYLSNPLIGISKTRLKKCVVKIYITPDEYKTITGEVYA